jgi:hypothetical protein
MIRQPFPAALCFILLAALPTNAWATPFISSSNLTPNPEGVYQSTNAVDFTKDYNVLSIVLRSSTGGGLPPTNPNTPVNSFFDIFTEISFDSGVTESGQTHGEQILTTSPIILPRNGRKLEDDVIGLTYARISGVMLRESPTLLSTGETTIEPLPGGLFLIDSFFDIFLELSLDGGQSWIPASGPIHLTSTPEPSTLVLATFGLISLTAWGWRRRKRSH